MIVNHIASLREKLAVSDFLRLKKHSPYKDMRHIGKQTGLSYLFSAGPNVLVPELKQHWKPRNVYDYLIKNGLMASKSEMTDSELENFITDDHYFECSKDIREKFMRTYSGLEKWSKEQISFASKHGYVEFPMGGKRHLPELTYEGRDVDGASWKNLCNISVNSPVQSFEAMIINKAIQNIYEELQAKNMKTKLVATIHDSIVLYVKKEEAVEVYSILKKHLDKPSEFSVPFESEIDFGTVWGFGEEVKSVQAMKELVSKEI